MADIFVCGQVGKCSGPKVRVVGVRGSRVLWCYWGREINIFVYVFLMVWSLVDGRLCMDLLIT